MAISSAMYAAVTGLSALGTGMQTISNNIANVNTVGFKAGRTNYEDLISQNYFSGGRVNQRGTGVKVSTIQSMFTQGAFMSSAQDTDMAIAGEGFFSVRNVVTNSVNYTRAGVFTLTEEGQLEDPSGNILQGWQMSIPKPGEEAVRIGMPTDVKVTVLNAPPVASSRIKVVGNLDSTDEATYLYRQYELAYKYAHQKAVDPAESAQVATMLDIYPVTQQPPVKLGNTDPPRSPTVANPYTVLSSGDEISDASIVALYNKIGYGLTSAATSADIIENLAEFRVISDAEYTSAYSTVGSSAYNHFPVTATTPTGTISVTQYNLLIEWATGPVATTSGIGHYTSATAVTNTTPGVVNSSLNTTYDQAFLKLYNAYYSPNPPIAAFSQFKLVDDSSILGTTERNQGYITRAEFTSFVAAARAEARAYSMAKGREVYDKVYNQIYDAEFQGISRTLNGWELEGNGFAEAWNAQETPPIEKENYTYHQPLTIYDSLGAEHKLNVYYQPNPHMDNVWDYIITCDPIEDARKDSNNSILFTDNASFSGLIQKGKITFTADGKDRHGGLIKDIEAQNIDLTKSKMATIEPKEDQSASLTMRNATIGGYFKGSPAIDPITGQQRASARTYTVTWAGNVNHDPVTSGMIWTDSDGNSGIIPVYDKQFAGPYSFGSGMTITFDPADAITGLRFGDAGLDTFTVTAHSEQISWTNLQPNEEGYFDFDVAFVQSASMALHPPYPEGMPTMYQTIAMDMGARNPHGLATEWILDEQSTTQYAGDSNTIYGNSDGYPMGSLQRVSIGEDGVLTGIFSNGRQQPLYQIGLTRFLNPWGLSKLGDNLFEETRYSGEGVMNDPGTAGTGTILANFLEQSNVDVAEEIVNMIVTQRGFQANSKTVTTTDSMLAEVIEMKR